LTRRIGQFFVGNLAKTDCGFANAELCRLPQNEAKACPDVPLSVEKSRNLNEFGPAAEAYLKKRDPMTTTKGDQTEVNGGDSPPRLIDAQIKKLADWRGDALARVRAIIKDADPAVVEEVKWRKPSNGMLGVPVWERDGIICTGETYKDYVKLTFAKGAALKDPSRLFNASLEGNVRRAIDIRERDRIDEKALKALVRAAAALNMEQAATRPRRKRKSA